MNEQKALELQYVLNLEGQFRVVTDYYPGKSHVAALAIRQFLLFIVLELETKVYFEYYLPVIVLTKRSAH